MSGIENHICLEDQRLHKEDYGGAIEQYNAAIAQPKIYQPTTKYKAGYR